MLESVIGLLIHFGRIAARAAPSGLVLEAVMGGRVKEPVTASRLEHKKKQAQSVKK